MIRIITGDCRTALADMPADSVQCCVTSPPYFGLRDYGHDGQIGLEQTPEAFVAELVAVFREVRRVLRPDGTLWLNLGDSYTSGGRKTRDDDPMHEGARNVGFRAETPAGLKPKDLIGVPWMVAFALRADGWYLRQDIIWHKPNPMPESVQDRCTKAHEYVFLLSKGPRYFFDVDAIREPSVTADRKGPRRSYKPGSASSHRMDGGHEAMTGAFAGLPLNPKGTNRRSVWTVSTQPYSGAHFATMPPGLAELCIKAGSRPGDLVIDPFGGAGTTGLVADRLQRDATLIEINPRYAEDARNRIAADAGLFIEAAE